MRLRARLRLWAIYAQLGYNPWHRERTPRKPRRAPKEGAVYIGAREAIPFLNDDAKRTFSDLLQRPGYMMRDYICRGQHERYLAPFTALLVFFSVFTLIVAVMHPKRTTVGDDILKALDSATVAVDSTDSARSVAQVEMVLRTMKETILLTHLDMHPEAVDAPWKESLAAVEGDLRSKGVPLFLGNFLLLWIALLRPLRRRGISGSGAAAASAYILCQYCIFMVLALLLSWGQSSRLGVLVMGLLLFVDFRQLLGEGPRKALGLTFRTGLMYLLVCALYYLVFFLALIVLGIIRA